MFEYCEDEVFLLSGEEYVKFRDNISSVGGGYWWLRSSTKDGVCVNDKTKELIWASQEDSLIAVRPALYYCNNIHISLPDTEMYYAGNIWEHITDGIFISKYPIWLGVNYNDERNSSYEESDIRRKLLDWIDEEKNKVAMPKILF